jgi:hypothetical protein
VLSVKRSLFYCKANSFVFGDSNGFSAKETRHGTSNQAD